MYKPRFLAIAALAFMGLTVVSVGCGGSSESTEEITTRSFTSQTVPMGGSRTGVLKVNLKSDGTASGELTVNDPSRARSRVIYQAVFYGTSQDNSFNLTGHFTTDVGSAPISIRGAVPGSITSGGTITIELEGQIYTGTFNLFLGTPGPPQQ